MANKALIIDDDRTTLELLTYQLQSAGFEVTNAESGKTGIEQVQQKDFDIILTDLHLPDISGIGLIQQAKEIAPSTEIIMITGDGSKEKTIEATKAGAFWYLEKPYDEDELLELIRRGVDLKHQKTENLVLRGKLTSRTSYEGVIGGARSMQNIYEIIENVAESDANILILGESGTGKEVVANAIHYKSHRANKPFVKVNCSALPKDLIESQLFGHLKGSFTGANTDKVGFIGQASGGSLLLDEIGEMPVDLQPKLLRVLQEKVYYRVGGDKPQEADFRLITSTNRDPFDAIKVGNLREDLYYRINTIEIKIPPLRERIDDVPLLAEHFLEIYADKYKRKNAAFSQSAYNQMLNSNWRGNVRELQHVIERAILLSKSGRIDHVDIERNNGEAVAASVGERHEFSPRSSEDNDSAQAGNFGGFHLENVSGEQLFEQVGKFIVENLSEPDEGAEQHDVFSDIESGVVLAALKRTKGNKQAAANLLGLYRPRLYGMIKRHNLDEKV